MQHEPIAPRDEPFTLASFARKVVLDGIRAAADDPGVMKERIMLARQCGHLTDEETRAWIARYKLEAA